MAQSMTSPRLILEPCTRRHLQGYHRIWSNPESTFWSSRGRSDRLEMSEKWLNGVRNDAEKPKLFSWAIFAREDKEDMLGIIVLSRSPPSIEVFGTECLLVGYFLHPSGWGRGYASEGLNAAIESVKGSIEGCKLVAWITPGNIASERVAKKCGFDMAKYHKRDEDRIFVGGQWRENAYNLFTREV